jgi:CRISPR-associated protein Cas6
VNVPTVDLSFPVTGETVPLDHGYRLYAAVTTRLPDLHGAQWLGIHPIGGQVVDDQIQLGRGSDLKLRLPSDAITAVLALAGARLDVGPAVITLGAPSIRTLVPAAALDARLVLLKLTQPPSRENAGLQRTVLDNDAIAGRYRAELQRQLQAMEVAAAIDLCGRRAITIKGKRLLGYSVRLTGLDADASIRVQERGLGGRRALGCGLFRPTRWTRRPMHPRDETQLRLVEETRE